MSAVQGLCTAVAAGDQRVAALSAKVKQLMSAVAQSVALPLFSTPSSTVLCITTSSPSQEPVWEPKVGSKRSKRYAGDLEGCGLFLTNCSVLFALQCHTFVTEPLTGSVTNVWHLPLTT